MLGLKRLVYRVCLRVLRTAWSLRGGRRVVLMGRRFTFAPATVLPTHRHMRLPREGAKSHIVRYTDFVQMHACCRYIESLVEPPTIVDVGAFHGAYAIVLGKMVQEKGGRVIAVEPNPSARQTLEWNVQANGLRDTVVVEPVACSEIDGTSAFSLFADQSQLGSAASGERIEVPVRRLQTLLHRYSASRVDLMIIDVEGAELPVLRGFPWGQVSVGQIFCELHPNEWRHFGYEPEDFVAFLRDRRLRCVDMYFQDYTETIPTDGYIGPCWLAPR